MTSWTLIGQNPYGDPVEEAAGKRRCATARGWVEEPAAEGPLVCRARNAAEARLATEAMAVPGISASFGHQAARAYTVWSTPPGTPTPNTAGPRTASAGWKGFEAGVERALGDGAARAWAAYRTDIPGVPRWTRTLRAPSATSIRGIQWGLARRLEAWPARSWYEWGLVEAGDAATRRLRTVARRLLAAGLGADPEVGAFVLSSQVPPPPDSKGAHFGASPAPAAPALGTPVVWCTSASRRFWRGAWEAWWAWLIQPGTEAWVVLDEPSTVKVLRQSLAGRPNWAAWSVIDAPHPTVIFHVGPAAAGGWQAITLADWAGPPPPADSRAPPLSVGDGRVVCRVLSRVGPPSGCAPSGLEACQHQALLDLAHEFSDIDAWVAEGLGVHASALPDVLSPEQVDAVAMARRRLESGRGFVLADATGFGKGRVLAALALTGLRQGRAVAFVTENAPLFSDFFRDVAAVAQGQLPHPQLLHQKAVVRLPDGTEWAKSRVPKAFAAWMRESGWAAGQDKLVLTTYAQISRAAGASDRPKWLRNRLGASGWLLLDEAHNAAGDSQASTEVARIFKDRGVVFASATFAKHEGNLDFYEPALPLDRSLWRWLSRGLASGEGLLREVMTQAMARAGSLLRREHTPMPPPQPVWVPMTPERQSAIASFESAWSRLFEVAEDWERAQGGRTQFAWLKLGAVLSRSVREFSLLIKRQALLDLIQDRLEADQKVVVAVDSTFEAALNECLLGSMPSEEEAQAPNPASILRNAPKTWEHPPRWKDRWQALLQGVAPEGYWSHLAPQNGPAWATDVERRWRAAAAAIADLPDWDVSPLDAIQRELQDRGVAVGELSGRQIQLSRTAQGNWEVVRRPNDSRLAIVDAFNAGRTNVQFITRAGSTGISLHAGRQFADQRRRCLVEWDIAPNPVNRVQFWGRVRRKDQVNEPSFVGLALDTPADRRVLEREARKHARMAAHLGASTTPPLGWVSPEGESVVAEWAEEHPQDARRLGVAGAIPNDPCARVDRALLRSMVLPSSMRAMLVERLDRGLEWAADWARRRRAAASGVSRVVRRRWWWGNDCAALGRQEEAVGVLRLDVVERVWAPAKMPKFDPMSVPLGEPGSSVFERWRAAWKTQARNGFPSTPARRAAWDWVAATVPLLLPGSGLFLTAPDTGLGVYGMVLGVETGGLDETSANWALSQVAVRVWLAGDDAPQRVPLSELRADPQFRLSNRPARAEWFHRIPSARRALAMEGNPVLAAAWGQRWGIGRSVLVEDAEHGQRVVWLLPATWTWEKLNGLPRDLVGVEHALDALKSFPDEPLAAAWAGGGLSLAIEAGSAVFRFAAGAYERAQKSWLGFALDRRLGHARSGMGPGGGETHHRVSLGALRPTLHAFEAAGIGWRQEACHAQWYQATSRAHCLRLQSPRQHRPR